MIPSVRLMLETRHDRLGVADDLDDEVHGGGQTVVDLLQEAGDPVQVDEQHTDQQNSVDQSECNQKCTH